MIWHVQGSGSSVSSDPKQPPAEQPPASNKTKITLKQVIVWAFFRSGSVRLALVRNPMFVKRIHCLCCGRSDPLH